MYKLIIVLFFITSCSIYDLSKNSNLSNLFLPNTDPDTNSTIVIQSPNISMSLVLDNLPLSILINDTNGISTIAITSPHGRITVDPLDFPSSFEVLRTIPISNQGTYHTSHGNYPLEISYQNRHSQIIKSNYTLNIKIESVYYTITYPLDRPSTTRWRATDIITIDVLDTGAEITRVEIGGTLGAHEFDYSSPIPNPIVIPLSSLSDKAPPWQINVLVRIISENNGVSTEAFELR